MIKQRRAPPSRTSNHLSTVARLKPLFDASQSARPVFLLGAGASYRAGVPLADEATKRIAREVCAQRVFGTRNVTRVKIGDWMRFLSEQRWFISGANRLAENFPLAVEHLLNPREYRRDFFEREMRAVNGLSEGYRALAKMAQRGIWRTTLTTNFDSCIVDALHELSPHIHRPVEINRAAQDSAPFRLFGRNPQIVYLHGAVDSYTDLNTLSETTALPANLAALLAPLLASSPLVVIGYRGAEPSVMNGLFESLIRDTQRFRCGIYWCTIEGQTLHERVEHLRAAVGPNFVHLTVDGFDELLVDLDEKLKTEDAYAQNRTTDDATQVELIANDERPVTDASMDDIDYDTMLATLATYCTRVERPSVTRANVVGLLLEQGLAAQVDGKVVPTIGGLLLFGKNVQGRLPQACVELTFGRKRRQMIRGNLVQQFNDLLQKLGDSEVNRELRIKTDTSSKKKLAYHPRSLTEMIVNLLVHRDYDIAEPSHIDVEEGRLIRFVNPGGLPEPVAKSVEVDRSGGFTPVRSLTALRNAALADIFYGLGPMDKKGSGLCDATQFMREHGGDARFAIQDSNAYFAAELLQARQASPETSDTAVALHPYGTYLTNHLRFALLPPTVSVVELGLSTRIKRPEGADLLGEASATAPIFIQQKQRLVSFCPPSKFTSGGENRIAEIDYFRTNPGGHGTLSHLLREHFVRYLARFRKDGLIVELGGHRAYFVKIGEETPTIRYDTVKRQGIEREMVKRREMKTEVYHENEGIAFDVVRFDGKWAVEVRPFYMFTQADGVTPLPPLRRARLTTSRIRFDRNLAVRGDLVFWARYLSGGSATIQLCPSGDYDLLLDGAFHEIEVVEFNGEEGTA